MARRTRKTRRAKAAPADKTLHAIPAYFWLACLYVGVAFSAEYFGAPVADGDSAAQSISAYLDTTLFLIPVVSGDSLAISWTVVFVILGFLCSWIEAFRAMNARGKAYNDVGSILTTIPVIVLLVGFETFQTTAFLVIAVVGFGDVILDRLVHRTGTWRDHYAV